MLKATESATDDATSRGLGGNFKGQDQGQAQGPYRFDIQLFADETPPDGGGKGETDGSGGGADKGDEKETEKITLTKEELDAKLQSETDKRVNQAMKTAQEKWDKDLGQKLTEAKAEAQKEAERLAKLSAEEKEKEVLSKAQKDLEEKERAITRKELELDTVVILQEKKLPIEFRDYVIGADKATTEQRIDALSKLFQQAVEAQVTEKLKGTPPNKGMDNDQAAGGKDYDRLSNMSMTEYEAWRKKNLK